MKILIVSDGVFPEKIGGMQKHTKELAYHLRLRGVDVNVLTPTYDQEGNDGVVSLPYFPGHYLFRQFLISRKLYKSKSSYEDYDLIISQGIIGTYWFYKGSHSNLGFHPHGLEMYQKSYGLKDYLQKVYLRLIVNYIVSKTEILFLLDDKMLNLIPVKDSKRKDIVLRNGISESWLLKKEKSRNLVIKFLFIGRNEKRKGYDILMNVIKSLECRDWELTVIGDFDKKCDSRVNYEGVINDEKQLKTFYDSCDILLLPSLAEGLPTVILEAFARGLPAIGFNVGAVSSLISKRTGWLVQRENEEQFKNCMMDAKRISQKKYLDLSNSCKRLVEERYTWNSISENVENLLKESKTR